MRKLELHLLVAASACVFASCGKVRTPKSDSPLPPPTATPAAPPPISTPAREPRVTSSEEGVATWYDLSEKSLPARRAPGELTAASDRLPMGSTVRVVNLSNHKSVLVRITDRGLNRRHGIDLCKDAAIEIGLVGKGVTKVRIERFDADLAAGPRP